MKILRLFGLLIVPVVLYSCGNSKKLRDSFYLQNLTDSTTQTTVQVNQLKIQKDDLLSIQVYSASTRAEVDQLYNLPATGGGGTGGSGFLVDANGNIEYPRLGTIHAEGLTKGELATVIKKKLTEPKILLEDPNVIIRFLNYKITVLGSVAKEGPISVPGEKVTILEAIGLAGGITDYGKKDLVKVVRENDGTRKVGYVNLTSDSLFSSPYYLLAQNDLIIVQPNGRREKDADQARVTQKISFALTLVTVAATLYNIFKN